MKLGELLHNLTELLQEGKIDIDADIFFFDEEHIIDILIEEIWSDSEGNKITLVG